MKQSIRAGILAMMLILLGSMSLAKPKQAVSPEIISSFPLYPLIVRAAVPARIAIPSISMDIAVKEASVTEDQWKFFDDAASFWEESKRPGEGGNIILYAHRGEYFGPLYEAKVGEKVIIETNQGRFSYTISAFRVVDPLQIGIFDPTDSEQVILLTCTNDDDSDRLVILAEPAVSFGDLLN